MKRFFIIGNGFDRYHGLNTDFCDFKSYLKTKKPEQYNFISRLISERNPEFESSDWGEIENNLVCVTELDYDQMLEDAICSSETDIDRASYWNDIQYNAEYSNRDLPNFKSSFDQWIEDIKIVPSLRTSVLRFCASDYFLNFNYTNTLQIAYGVRDSHILHIHGKLGTEKAFGHNINSAEPFRKSGLTQEDYNYGFEDDWRIEEAKSIINKIPMQFFKNSALLIEKNKLFFEQISRCDDIVFMGWSLGDQDKIYMEKILSVIQIDSKVHVVYYSKDCEVAKKYKIFLKKHNIPSKNVKYYTWERVQELFGQVEEV